VSTKPNSKFYVSMLLDTQQRKYRLHHNQRLYKDPQTALMNAWSPNKDENGNWRQGPDGRLQYVDGKVLVVDLDACVRWFPEQHENLHEEFQYAEHMMITWAERLEEIKRRIKEAA
jgi:hypothetical protein